MGGRHTNGETVLEVFDYFTPQELGVPEFSGPSLKWAFLKERYLKYFNFKECVNKNTVSIYPVYHPFSVFINLPYQ